MNPYTPFDLSAMFKAAMMRLAASESILTTSSDGSRFGMVVKTPASFVTQSPAVFICVNRPDFIHDPLVYVEGSFRELDLMGGTFQTTTR